MIELPNGLWTFAIENNDFVPITGKELVFQRIEHRLKVRKRYYPNVTEEIMEKDEVLKNNVDEEGKPYYPGELDELGHPEYGSLLPHYIGLNDDKYGRGMLFLDLMEGIGLESFDSNIKSINRLSIEKGGKDKFIILIDLTLGKGSESESSELNFEV